MNYWDISLPSKTIKMLQFILKNDGKINPILLANGCSHDETWPRINQLVSSGLVCQEQAHANDGTMTSGSVLWVTNEGHAFLTDYKNVMCAKRKERLITVLISAGTAALISWGPKLLWLILSLLQSPQ